MSNRSPFPFYDPFLTHRIPFVFLTGKKGPGTVGVIEDLEEWVHVVDTCVGAERHKDLAHCRNSAHYRLTVEQLKKMVNSPS